MHTYEVQRPTIQLDISFRLIYNGNQISQNVGEIIFNWKWRCIKQEMFEKLAVVNKEESSGLKAWLLHFVLEIEDHRSMGQSALSSYCQWRNLLTPLFIPWRGTLMKLYCLVRGHSYGTLKIVYGLSQIGIARVLNCFTKRWNMQNVQGGSQPGFMVRNGNGRSTYSLDHLEMSFW